MTQLGVRSALGLVLLLVAGRPSVAAAQADTTTLHATLKGWEEDTWLTLLNRPGAAGGRLSRNGILQRFDPQIDHEYQLDLISGAFGLTEDYDWYRHATGARYWGASYNNRFLVTSFNIKAVVPLGRAWTATVRFDKDDRQERHRNLIRLEFGRTWRSGFFQRTAGTLEPEKPNTDLEIQAGYRRRPGREIGLGFGILDVFSDLIYQKLVVWSFNADTALDYERQPFTVRTWGEWSVGPRLRVEASGGVMTPTRVRAYRQVAPDSGFRQNEAYGFAGGLLEVTPAARLRMGGFASYVRARIDRTPLPQSPADDDFVLTEITSRLGAYGLAQLANRWRLEAWLSRTTRPERRDQRRVDSLDVDFEDHWLSGEARITYRAPSGFWGDASYEFVDRDVARGAGQVPAPQPAYDRRMRLEIGWRLTGQVIVGGGYRMDLDGDRGEHGLFDGAHGRFVIYW